MKWTVRLIVLLMLGMGIGATLQAKIPLSERDALIALYLATDGDHWTVNWNWRQGDDPTAFNDWGTEQYWYGFQIQNVNGEDHVVVINLDGNNLKGSLPVEIGEFPYLGKLSLGNNIISGPIPDSIGNLCRISWLNMYYNSLNGPLPASIGQLSSLETLWLAGNQLSGQIPVELCNLVSLRDLWLGRNEIEGQIPAAIGQLINLEFLDFTNNHLEGNLPDGLWGMTRLKSIRLGVNNFSGSIPGSVGQLSNLEDLDFSGNTLGGEIPATLGHLDNLRVLFLHNNQLTGSIPADLGNLKNLEELWLHTNQLTGAIPPTLGQLNQLSYLHLSNNLLTGPIPAELGQADSLWRIILSNNLLTDTIPSALGDLDHPGWLDFSNNLLTGSIPPELLKTSEWWYWLDLSHNQISGSIPTEIGQLTTLEYLYLDSNLLSGQVPSSILQLTNLGGWHLDLTRNALLVDDPSVLAFIDSHSSQRPFLDYQTVPPAEAHWHIQDEELALTWEPVDYQSDPGGYEIYWKDDTMEAFVFSGVVEDKAITSFQPPQWNQEEPLSNRFLVRTYTEPCPDNANLVRSDWTEATLEDAYWLSEIHPDITPRAGESNRLHQKGNLVRYYYLKDEDSEFVTQQPVEDFVLQANAHADATEIHYLADIVDVTGVEENEEKWLTAEEPIDGGILRVSVLFDKAWFPPGTRVHFTFPSELKVRQDDKTLKSYTLVTHDLDFEVLVEDQRYQRSSWFHFAGSAGFGGSLGSVGAEIGPLQASFSTANLGVGGELGIQMKLAQDQNSVYNQLSYQLNAGLGPEGSLIEFKFLTCGVTGPALNLKAGLTSTFEVDFNQREFLPVARRVAITGALARLLGIGGGVGTLGRVIDSACDQWLQQRTYPTKYIWPHTFFSSQETSYSLEGSLSAVNINLPQLRLTGNIDGAVKAGVKTDLIGRGKTYSLAVGTAAGGSFNLLPMVVARQLGKEMPTDYTLSGEMGYEAVVNSANQVESLALKTEMSKQAAHPWFFFTSTTYTGYRATWEVKNPDLIDFIGLYPGLSLKEVHDWASGQGGDMMAGVSHLAQDAYDTLDHLKAATQGREHAKAVSRKMEVRRGRRAQLDFDLPISISEGVGLELSFNVKAGLGGEVEQDTSEAVLYDGQYFVRKQYEDYGAQPDLDFFTLMLKELLGNSLGIIHDNLKNYMSVLTQAVHGAGRVAFSAPDGQTAGGIELPEEAAGLTVGAYLYDSKIELNGGGATTEGGISQPATARYTTFWLKENITVQSVGDPAAYFEKTGIVTNRQVLAFLKQEELTRYLSLVGQTVALAIRDGENLDVLELPAGSRLVLTVTDSDLERAGFTEADLPDMTIVRYDPALHVWEEMPDVSLDGRELSTPLAGPGTFATGIIRSVDLTLDLDHDGLADSQEDANGNGLMDEGETSPIAWDTDGDGFSDALELERGTDPLDPVSAPEVHSLELSTTAGGLTEPAPGWHAYWAGSEVILRAIPWEGFAFDTWSGSVLGNSNPVMLHLDEDTALTAHFFALGPVPGDLNLDWRCDAVDMVLLAHCLAENIRPGEGDFLAPPEQADLDGDGRLTVIDLALMPF